MIGEVTARELDSQPEAWGRLLARLPTMDAPLPADFAEVVLVGSGSSYYLALALADWVRRRAAVPVRAVPSCEVLLDPWEGRARDPGTLAVALSRSGESSEALLALEALARGGATTLAVSCTEGSSLLARGDHALLVHEGREDGLVMLRSFTGMLLALQWLWGSAEDRAALARLPGVGRGLLDAQGPVRDLAARPFDRFVVLASAEAAPLGPEAALKVGEMSVSTAESYHTLEYRHGPKATADARTLVALVPPRDRRHGEALARDVRALGAALMVVGPGAEGYEADLAIPVDLPHGAASAATLLPLQVLAHATALRLGRDPDAPVNLSRVVTF